MIGSTLKTTTVLGFLALAACTQPATPIAPAAPAAATSASPSAVGADGLVTLEAANTLVKSASQGRASVERVFKGEDGMTGAIATNPNGTKDVLFISPGGKVLFPGGGFTAEGKNIAQEALVSQHVYISPAELADKITPNGFVVGTKGPIITAFMDPNCSWCHVFYGKITPLVAAGQVRIRFVMVGMLKPSSPGRAAAIYAAKDPAAALKKDEAAFDEKQEEGGLPPVTTDETATAKVMQNNALMGSAGPVSTPSLLYCDKAKKAAVYTQGMPQDINALVAGASTEGHASCAN